MNNSFMNIFFWEMINFDNIGLSNLFLWVSLLSFIFVIIDQVSSFIAYKTFFIEFIGNTLPFQKQAFSFYFYYGNLPFSHNIYFKYSKRAHSFFEQLIVLFILNFEMISSTLIFLCLCLTWFLKSF